MDRIQQLLGNVPPILCGGNSLIVSDGAMATLLHQKGVPVRTCSESLNTVAPKLVEEVHRAYVGAGANVIQTNTFSGHRSGLERHGLQDKVTQINRKGAEIALRVANGQAAVYGTVGSIAGVRLQGSNIDARERSDLRFQFEEQASALLSEAIHGILLETFADLEEMLLAIETVRALTHLPIVANLAPDEVGVTRDGIALTDAFREMTRVGATAVGLNCKLGPHGILRCYESLELTSDSTYVAVPNAGYLHMEDGDYAYTGNANYFADIAAKFAQVGVRWIGGCCGTTPEYIKAVRARLEGIAKDELVQQPIPLNRPMSISVNEQSVITPPVRTLVDRVRSDVTVIVELDPPKTLDCRKYIEGAVALHQAGADFITLADNSLGTIRVSNLALSSVLKQHGVEPLVHVTCRDRNLIGQQSHLMGLNLLDIHHVLLITGDPSKFGDLPGATSVYDVSSIELTKMVRRLNEGTGFSGQALKKPAQFVVGTAFNPHVRNFDKAIERLYRKVEAGADYVMTQPIFDIGLVEKLKESTRALGVPIFIGVMPLVSARNASFLHHEVPGIEIPEEILTRMYNVDPADASNEGLRIAESLLTETLQYFQGIYLITPFLRYGLTVQLTQFVKSQTKIVV